MNSPGKNTGVGSLSLLQGIFPTQGLNPGLPHCRWILYHLSHKGSPRILEWVAYPFSRGSSQPRNRTGFSCIAGGSFTNWAMKKVCPYHITVSKLNPSYVKSGQTWSLLPLQKKKNKKKHNSMCRLTASVDNEIEACLSSNLYVLNQDSSFSCIPHPFLANHVWKLLAIVFNSKELM